MSTPFLPGCPWYDLNSKYPPNISWCEEKICSYFVTPFNTWTNLAYLLVAFLIWRKAKNSQSNVLRFFSAAAIWVGTSSFVFHMSLNSFTQVFDYFGMYVFLTLMLMSNLSRMGKWGSGSKGKQQFWLATFALTLITYGSTLVHFPIQLYVVVLIIAIMRTELIQKVESRKYFWMSVAALLVAAVISALDLTRVLCWPENHWFQGHGMWHIINSASLYFGFLHASQFEKQFLAIDQK